jgi:hypothetical protein
MILKFYDFVFFRILKFINLTNKSIPEWSTIILLSTVIFININTLSFYLGISYKEHGADSFRIFIFLLIFINYFIFLYKKRYLKIIDRFSKSVNKYYKTYDLLILIYICLSIFTFCTSLKFQTFYSLLFVLLVCLFCFGIKFFYKT